jgi:hypothetical protein
MFPLQRTGTHLVLYMCNIFFLTKAIKWHWLFMLDLAYVAPCVVWTLLVVVPFYVFVLWGLYVNTTFQILGGAHEFLMYVSFPSSFTTSLVFLLVLLFCSDMWLAISSVWQCLLLLLPWPPSKSSLLGLFSCYSSLLMFGSCFIWVDYLDFGIGWSTEDPWHCFVLFDVSIG